MFEFCLALQGPLTAPLINDVAYIALYFPWFSFAATWILSTAFYNGETFFLNMFVNYVLFATLWNAAHILGVQSPVATPCASFLFDSYRFVLPSATFVVSMTYYTLLVLYHYRKRHEWWGQRNIMSTWLFIVIILGFPLCYLAALLYFNIMPWDVLSFNLVMTMLFVTGLTLFSIKSRLWRSASKAINKFMGWILK